MTTARRLLPAALAAAAILLVPAGLSGCGDDEEPGGTQTARAPASDDTEGGERATKLALEVRHGEPVGGPKELKVKKGEQVEITVRSDARGRIHLHGYETYEQVTPGKEAVFDFKADIEGLFDMEIEETGTELVELEVGP